MSEESEPPADEPAEKPETLEDRLAADGPLAAGAARRLVRDLDTALTRAHEAGLVHGHLTAARVVFDADGTAQLSGLRSTPPEPAEGAPRPSRLEDQRAFAAVVYQALTGSPPAAPDSEDWKPVAQVRPDVPRALDTVFARGLHRDAASRYPDVLAFGHAFDASFARLASPSRPMLALAMLGPLAILAIGVLWAMSGGGGDDDGSRRPAPAPVTRPAADAGAPAPR